MNIKNTPDRQHSNAYELSRKPCLQCVILNQDKNVVPVQLLLSLERKTSADAEQLVRKLEDNCTILSLHQVSLPLKCCRILLFVTHDAKPSAHICMRKAMIAKFRQIFYWPGLCSDKDRTTKAPMEKGRSGNPIERLALEILVPLPEIEQRPLYILVTGDYFSTWTEIFAMRNKKAET
ncbi:hypothetical protein MAR_030702, partial [Mya arenaria]